MKKLVYVAILAITAAAFSTSCNQAPKANLKTDVDTMSYAFGVAQAQQVQDYFQYQGIDSAYLGAFIKGLTEGANAGDDKRQTAYYAGVQIGQQIARQWVKGLNGEIFGDDSTQTVSLKNILAGFVDGAKKDTTYMTGTAAQMEYQRLMPEIKKAFSEKRYAENREAGEKFLAENAKKEGVVTLPSGLQYKVITEGKGAMPADTSLVEVNYAGGPPPRRHRLRQLLRAQAARQDARQPGHQRMDRSSRTHARRFKVGTLHPAGTRLWRPRHG